MNKEVKDFMSNTDGAIIEGAVKREEKRDLGGLVMLANQQLESGQLRGVIKVQWTIITALANTIVKLEKRYLLMDGKRGR